MADRQPRIFVAGHSGMVGSAIMRRLQAAGYDDIITRTRSELDLLDQHAVHDFFQEHRIEQVYLAAAKVGGIHANKSFPVDFIHDNLVIQNNVIHGAFQAGVRRLLFLGSSCIYPRDADQPMREEAMLTGPLEPTNEPYAIAKIGGIKLCESYNRQYGTDYRCVMPTNLYGPGDNFHPENSHVIPALIRRFHEAHKQRLSEVTIWGSGKPKREFLHVDDAASACLHVMDLDKGTYMDLVEPHRIHLNVGSGKDCTIKELATMIRDVVGYEGKMAFDAGKPDGAPRKLLDVSRLSRSGWSASIPLTRGLADTYAWYRKNHEKARG